MSTPAPPLPAVAPHGPPLDRGELALAARDAGEDLLEGILAEADDAEARIRLDAGRPGERLVAAAEEEDAALLVVGTHGDGAARTALLGSVALDSVRHAPCPVVVVPPGAEVADHAPLAGETLLCGVEGDDDRVWARLAARLAHKLDLTLTLAHILPRTDDATRAAVPGRRSWQQLRREAGLDVLRAVAQGIPGRAELRIATGEPADELDALAVEEHAVMVVVGTRGYGPLRAALLGSVSRRLACRGSRPLVVCTARASREG